MDNWPKAWAVLKAHEGGDTTDDGGFTHIGWTLAALAKIGIVMTADELKNTSEDTVASWYQEHYWNEGPSQLKSDTVATKMLDMMVNMEDPVMEGQYDRGQAVKIGQQAVGVVFAPNPSPVEEDGVFGPQTIAGMNACSEYLLVRALKLKQGMFYRNLAAQNPAKYSQYLSGWLLRAAWPTEVV